ncbi:SecDF P1 head subdomain-containing protein [Luteolibacter luteus]|uniref:SecDF P1 head subdomain domain-containing protein n=1 Tax=Luteolibacter luteus TaxID=2728835 RepID=A0A858RMG9_9BACT|nr:hypothetical protein [Luteolibacter luteus]QJE97380.1 hypothetical protein HHL09_16830 [Luteolibacter luteus]
MRLLHIAIPFLGIGLSQGEILRISRAFDEPVPGAERMELKYRDEVQQIFVVKEAIISDADVKNADASVEEQIQVELNEEGAKKMKAATTGLAHGKDRFAVLVDGRVVTAPVVRDSLGARFFFNVAGLSDEQMDDLARRISGRPPRPKGEAFEAKPLQKHREVVPYSEQEYLQLKAGREKMGIYYLDRLPTDEDLSEALRVGMSRNEVEKVLGKPTFAQADELFYGLAPEKLPENPDREFIPCGLRLRFQEEKLSQWSVATGPESRSGKAIGAEQPSLVVLNPEMDLTSLNFDPVELFEGCKVPNPDRAVNRTDLEGLVRLVMMFVSMAEDRGLPESAVTGDCDLMKILEKHFPEAANLKKDTAAGKISLKKLKEAFEPYAVGGKPLPEAKAAPVGKE